MDKCSLCENEFKHGSGVEHETDDEKLYMFCSMQHFKTWYYTCKGELAHELANH